MRRLAAFSLIFLLPIAGAVSRAQGDTLTVITEFTYQIVDLEACGIPSSAVLLGDDSIMFISGKGLFVGSGSAPSWKEVIGCVPLEESVPFSVCGNRELDRIIRPRGLWRVSGRNGDEVLVLDRFCGQFYSIRYDDDGHAFARRWRQQKGQDSFDEVNIQDNMILAGLCRFSSKKAVAIQYADKPGYRRLFDVPAGLTRRLDSLQWSIGYSLGIPALNPGDSTLWLAITTYDYIYIIDLDGRLVDSLHIDAPDYLLPPPLKSRVKSNAVYFEWARQWTPISSFAYSSPGYFLLQYYHRTITEEGTSKGFFHYSTLAWDTAGRPMQIDIGSRWRLAGVHADGRVVYAHPVDPDDRDKGWRLTVVRLQP